MSSAKKKYLKNKSDYERLMSMDFNRKVQKVINKNLETKFKTLTLNGIAVDDGGANNYNCIDLNQGDTQLTRTGNRVMITGFHYHVQFMPNAGTLNDPHYIARARFIVYIPKDPTTNLASTPVLFNDLIDQDKHTVLYDKVHNVQFRGGSANTAFVVKRSFKKGGRKGIACEFNGTGSTDFSKNPIKIYIIGDQSLATEEASVWLRGRCYFKDG